MINAIKELEQVLQDRKRRLLRVGRIPQEDGRALIEGDSRYGAEKPGQMWLGEVR